MIAAGFDFDHTLGTDGGLERQALYAYARELGRPLADGDDGPKRSVDECLASFRNGALSMDAAIAHFGTVLGAHATGARWREICCGLVDELVRPIDGAVEMLARLQQRGVRIAILTNGWTPLQQRKIARALGAIDFPVLVSDRLGVQKPARAAFDALVAALAVDRSDIWYVGDNPAADVAGALGAGLRAVWFDWEGVPYPPDAPAPTRRIHALRELEDAVENTYAP